MVCQEVKTQKYQTRKSPAFHAKDCKGLSKKGKDGVYISKPDARGIYKWVLNTTKKLKGKYYDIHDNGRRPFRVFIDGLKVSIYKDTELIKTLDVKKAYIGKSTGKTERSDHTPADAKKFVGNSILLHVSGKKYIHIGVEIYSFEMEDNVEAYFSMIGGNDVPYPVVLGTDNVYFMLESEHNYVPRINFPAKMNNIQWENAYMYYYGNGDSSLKTHAKKMKNIHMIQKRA
jgi:hypothetical protein